MLTTVLLCDIIGHLRQGLQATCLIRIYFYLEVFLKCIRPEISAQLSALLDPLAATFTDHEAGNWFEAAVAAFMVRMDHEGVSSIIRALDLDHDRYQALLNFFRSEAWDTDHLACALTRTAERNGSPLQIAGRTVLIGDGTLVNKFGKFMPGISKIGKVTGNSPAKIYLNAHLFGIIALLSGTMENHHAIPVYAAIQQALKEIAAWKSGEEFRAMTHIQQMAHSMCFLSRAIGGNTLAVLDRLFLSQDLLDIFSDARGLDSDMYHFVTRAKRGIRGFLPLSPDDGLDENGKRKPGRPRKTGGKVNIFNLFNDPNTTFTAATVTLYGKKENVLYCVKDLLWGHKRLHMVRFVLVKWNGNEIVLVCSDTSLTPEQIIETYGLRFSIEECIKKLKNDLNAFDYEFWSKEIEAYDQHKTKNEKTPLQKVQEDDTRAQELIVNTIHAYENHVMVGVSAMAVLELLLHNPQVLACLEEFVGTEFFMRTPSTKLWSLKCYLQRRIFRGVGFGSRTRLNQAILNLQRPSGKNPRSNRPPP